MDMNHDFPPLPRVEMGKPARHRPPERVWFPEALAMAAIFVLMWLGVLAMLFLEL